MKRILVVEDDYTNQVYMKSVLKKYNFEFALASNGADALKEFEGNVFDLILMDLGLPDTNGIDITKIIREQEVKKATHVPIIAVTANTYDNEYQNCMAAGMDAFLEKPITEKELIDEISRYLI